MKRTISILTLAFLLLFTTTGMAPDSPKTADIPVVRAAKAGDSGPEFILIGADKPLPKGDIGELKIEAKGLPTNAGKIRYRWRITFQNGPERRIKYDGGESGIEFGTGLIDDVATVEWIVAYAVPVLDKDGKVIDTDIVVTQINRSRVILGNEPAPTPVTPITPPAPIQPDPVLPTGQYNFAQKTFDVWKQLAFANKVEIAKGFSSNFRAVAANIENRKYASLDAAFTELKELNGKLSTKSDMKSFDDMVTAEVYKLYQDKKLKMVADYSPLFKEIAIGLDAVR